MGVKDVVVLDEATEDLEVGKAFYDAREYGIGDYFIDCIFANIASPRLYAGIHPTHSEYLRMLSKRFPFAIYYDIEDQLARIVAILDMRMNPDTIQKTLNKRS